MSNKTRRENAVLASPMVLFLLAILGFPTVLSVIYGVSDTTFETLTRPEFSGLSNFVDVLSDPTFWQAAWFSLRFGLVTALLQCALGLALAVYLAPLVERHGWTVAVLIIPIMVAPAMMGLMYRLVLHEFAGPLPYYLYAWFGTAPSFLGPAHVFKTVVLAETLQWTPFAFVLFLTAYQAIPPRVARGCRRGQCAAVGCVPPYRMAAHAADALCRAVRAIHRRIPGFRQHLHAGWGRSGGIDNVDVNLHL